MVSSSTLPRGSNTAALRRGGLLLSALLSLLVAGCDGGGGGDGGTGGDGGSGASAGNGGGGQGGGGQGGGGNGGSGAGDAQCGGIAGLTCEEDAYCDFPDDASCGADDQTGTCQPRPDACQRDCPGVCGCDGQFYCNACIAASAGVDVDPLASCAPPGDVCGGLAGTPCGPDEYCDYPDDSLCGAADQTGVCTPRPDACTDDCPGVCACDGQSYCNACEAAAAGVDVISDGPCEPQQDICGGFAGFVCDPDQYCNFPDDAMCGAADQTGVCAPKPEACPQDCPGVCGCDGQFYCNECIAAAAGMDVTTSIDCSN